MEFANFVISSRSHFAQLRADGVADVQGAQVLPERVLAFGLEREVAVRAGVPDAGDGGQHVRRALDGGALHVVQDGADAAELLAAAGAAGAAVDQVRDRGAVAGGAAGVLAVEHEHAAVVGGDAGDELAGHGGIVGADRGDERAAAAGGEADGVGQVRVADHRGHRAEGLQRVDLFGLRVGPAQQHRGHEGAVVDDADAAVRAGDLRRIERAVGEFAAGVEHGLDGGAHIGELLQGRQGAHVDALGARVAQHDAFAGSAPPRRR